MNHKQLRVFKTVMERRSMTAAAKELNSSQPSISRQIAELEASLRMKLFNRETGQLIPTEEGAALYEEVRKSFIALDHIAQAANNIRRFGTRHLRVVVMPALSHDFIAHALAQFRALWPEVVISLDVRADWTIRRWIAGGQYDLGLAGHIAEGAGISLRPLYRLSGVCVLPQYHRLAERPVIEARDLAGETLIAPAYTDLVYGEIERVLRSTNVDWNRSVSAPYGTTICSLVEQGVGIGIVNPIVAIGWKGDGVVFKPFLPSIPFQCSIVMQSPQPSNPFVARFGEMVERHSAEIGAQIARRFRIPGSDNLDT